MVYSIPNTSVFFILICIKYNSIVYQIQLYFLYFRPISNAKFFCYTYSTVYQIQLYCITGTLQLYPLHCTSNTIVPCIKISCIIYKIQLYCVSGLVLYYIILLQFIPNTVVLCIKHGYMAMYCIALQNTRSADGNKTCTYNSS